MARKEILLDPKAEKLRDWTWFNNHHARRYVYGKPLDFWPDTGKWSFNGQYRLGGLYQFIMDAKRAEQGAIRPQPVKRRIVAQEYLDSLHADLQDAYWLLKEGGKASVRIFVAHLESKIQKCEVAA